MSDLLDPAALLQVLPTLLPASSISNSADALAVLIHTILTRLDFRLTGLSEDDRLPASSTASEASASTSSNKLPPNWNHSSPSHYAFRYKHNQSSLDFLIKLVKLGNKVVIHGIALQGTKTSTMEITLTDFISTNFWPYPRDGGEGEPLVNGYIGSSRVKDLVDMFKGKVLQELVPGLRKDGYQETVAEAGESGNTRASGSASGPTPSAPRAPLHEDDRSTQPSFLPPFRNPLIIGDRDLDPLGGTPFAPPPRFGNGGPFAPPPLFPGADTGGGMMVGPNHPIFRNRHPPPASQGLPPGAVPPGARFDPIYPGAPFGPRGEPDVGGPRTQTGDPDWDELAPPGPEGPFARPRGNRGFGPAPDTTGWYA